MDLKKAKDLLQSEKNNLMLRIEAINLLIDAPITGARSVSPEEVSKLESQKITLGKVIENLQTQGTALEAKLSNLRSGIDSAIKEQMDNFNRVKKAEIARIEQREILVSAREEAISGRERKAWETEEKNSHDIDLVTKTQIELDKQKVAQDMLAIKQQEKSELLDQKEKRLNATEDELNIKAQNLADNKADILKAEEGIRNNLSSIAENEKELLALTDKKNAKIKELAEKELFVKKQIDLMNAKQESLDKYELSLAEKRKNLNDREANLKKREMDLEGLNKEINT